MTRASDCERCLSSIMKGTNQMRKYVTILIELKDLCRAGDICVNIDVKEAAQLIRRAAKTVVGDGKDRHCCTRRNAASQLHRSRTPSLCVDITPLVSKTISGR